MPLSTFTWIPSTGASADTEANILEAKFGDGYAQRAANGLNSMPNKWMLRFDPITVTDCNDIIAFLRAHGGHTPFLWTPPEESEGQYVCKSWKRVASSYGSRAVEATFEEDFAP